MKKSIRFAKMHGLGNDFVVIDCVTQNIHLTPKLIRAISDRHFGIGCDQVLLVEPPTLQQEDFFYRIYNADGSEAEQCGNGARCIGRFIKDEGLFHRNHMNVGTKKGPMSIEVESDGQVTVTLGPPKFEPKDVPVKALRQNQQEKYAITIDGKQKDVSVLSLGNPHCVFFVPSIKDAPVEELGKKLQKNSAFQKGVNVGFVQVLARNHIKLRVFERGVGETFACGSGATAAVIAGILKDELGEQVKVDMKGGSVLVRWPKSGPAFLTGATFRVYDGVFSAFDEPKNQRHS